MTVQIEFFDGKREHRLPLIRLTKSRNKTTGTATFLFIQPFVFFVSQTSFLSVSQMSLIWAEGKIFTKDIIILFHNGKPFGIKSTFIFKNSKEWFEFLNFMQYYSKETGLSFTEILT